ILAAWYEAREAGDDPDRAAFLARHPDLAGELASFFAARDEFELQAGPLLPPPNVLGGTTRPSTNPPPPDRPPGAGAQLLGELGRGGMGVVYRGRQVRLDRIVALKMIRAAGLASHEDVQRFRGEAAVVASLDHPNIVPIYEVGEHGGLPWYSMKLLHGGSLAQ